MKKYLAILTLIGSFAHAGGSIGGGEVKYKPLMKCDNEVAPENAIQEVWIVKETDDNGKVITEAELRIAPIDKDGKATDYFVTRDSDIYSDPDGSVNIPIYRYSEGGDNDDEIIGAFGWQELTKSGSLLIAQQGLDLQIFLANCRMQKQMRKK
ncbi:MAG: hypothetical protein SGJ18_15285 [Pseudomonadota bacterium]|mgnify:CR=1 FL=1|nr:hypothetical protein [Pseudomonadota bacterium]